MSTTVVTGTGRRSSVLLSELQMPANTPGSQQKHMTSPIDKFPPFSDDSFDTITESREHHSGSSVRYAPARLEPRKTGQFPYDEKAVFAGNTRQRSRKSISETISTIRTRNGSVSANAQELAEALKAPVSYRLITLCLIWYLTSALTNTSSKSILNALPKPITLTMVQFAFVSFWCLLLSSVSKMLPSLKDSIPALKHGIHTPSRDIIVTALPLAIFQLAGHILSSMATSQIPVSLVHTIKGLSPLFTVMAYRVLFRIRYARATYLSLIPLTLGVMLACSTGVSTNFFGIFCALVAALVFVSQNIFSKKLFNEAARAESNLEPTSRRKLDKLNLLYYCSGLAFVLTLPIWFVCEGYPLISDVMKDGAISLTGKEGSLDHGALFLEFVFNGVSHFAQNILAFILLSMISPVSYSVASLVKRVFVIIVAIVWFGSSTTPVQGLGILLTFVGLYLYDRNSHDDLADQRANADRFRVKETVLPLNVRTPARAREPIGFSPAASKFPDHQSLGDPLSHTNDLKKVHDGPGYVRPRGSSTSRAWLAPGIRQPDYMAP
ncbi:TPT-domain-containing protein [Aspergillus japonicus CBS 114.51]|uniref:TPT-domain-containing protein n=2 Tax=Aspergillus TaxID=5052 RepID=A0A2V5GZ79_ASPV1|nr:TPT-domain-containing protein [Aspergillus japonicus CBS 114.51]PYI13673.1 TPT-domain-containing protein [Aspergillus violaceofuscus CBS 115571]RAH80081.1 TPT-domain-containing protein [Aspergillus japonicus CBS 114.51]